MEDGCNCRECSAIVLLIVSQSLRVSPKRLFCKSAILCGREGGVIKILLREIGLHTRMCGQQYCGNFHIPHIRVTTNRLEFFHLSIPPVFVEGYINHCRDAFLKPWLSPNTNPRTTLETNWISTSTGSAFPGADNHDFIHGTIGPRQFRTYAISATNEIWCNWEGLH